MPEEITHANFGARGPVDGGLGARATVGRENPASSADGGSMKNGEGGTYSPKEH